MAPVFEIMILPAPHCCLTGHWYWLRIPQKTPHPAHCFNLPSGSTSTSSSSAHCNPLRHLGGWTWSFSTAPADFESPRSFWPTRKKLGSPILRRPVRCWPQESSSRSAYWSAWGTASWPFWKLFHAWASLFSAFSQGRFPLALSSHQSVSVDQTEWVDLETWLRDVCTSGISMEEIWHDDFRFFFASYLFNWMFAIPWNKDHRRGDPSSPYRRTTGFLRAFDPWFSSRCHK